MVRLDQSPLNKHGLIGIFDIKHDDLVVTLSVLVEHSLLLVQVLLIGAIGGIEVPSSVEAQWLDVFLINTIGFLDHTWSFFRLGDDGPYSDHFLYQQQIIIALWQILFRIINQAADPSLLIKYPRDVVFLVFSLCFWQSEQYHFSGRFFSQIQLVWNHSLSQYGFSQATISPKDAPPQQQYWGSLGSQKKSERLGAFSLLASIFCFLRLRISSYGFSLYLFLSQLASMVWYSITSLQSWSETYFFSLAQPYSYFCLLRITSQSAFN